MRKLFTGCFFLFSILLIVWSCQKEIEFNTADTGAAGGSGNNGGSINGSASGWSFTVPPSTAYRGCIDTAYYETVGPLKVLNIDGIDSAGNEFSILLAAQTGTFTPGTYTPQQGAQMSFTKTSGQSYSSSLPSSLTIQLTTINDTLVIATFSASLIDPFGGAPFAVSNGNLKARIGKYNGCPVSTGGGSNGVFTLVDLAGDCFNADVQGTYRKGTTLTAANKTVLNVNVSAIGPWSLTTATLNGFKFAGTGTFTFAGPQTITLQGSGTPTAFGNTIFPVSAGGANCGFVVPVDTLAVAPCTPASNSVSFSTAGIGNFTVSSVLTSQTGFSYQIDGNGSGDIRFEFAGSSQPTAGVYRIQPVNGSFINGDVRVSIVASSILWQPAGGNVYVSVANGKVTATFCNVAFSGSLGGPSFNTQATAKITQP